MRIPPALPQQLLSNVRESHWHVIHVAPQERNVMVLVLIVELVLHKTGHVLIPLRRGREVFRRDTFGQLSCHLRGYLNRFLVVKVLFINFLHRMMVQKGLVSLRQRIKPIIDYIDDGTRVELDRKSTRLNSSHSGESRMPSSA